MQEEARIPLEDVVDRSVRSMAAALAEDWDLPSEREALLEIAWAVERRLAESGASDRDADVDLPAPPGPTIEMLAPSASATPTSTSWVKQTA